MRSDPLVSVITVTLNDVSGLKAMSESLAAQTYGLVEHVIVDGRSTDGTRDWLDAYTPRYSTIKISEPDDGIFDAMNKGARVANGDLLIFMNSGDAFSSPIVLESISSHWRAGNWQWGYGAMRYVDSDHRITGPAIQAPYSRRRLELGLAFAPHQATAISHALFDHLGGFDLDFEYACDQEFAMRAARVSDPEIWLEFFADFLTGGVHSQTTYWHRERLYHRMRKKNQTLLCGRIGSDRAFTEAMALYRTTREGVASIIRENPIRNSKVLQRSNHP